MKEVRKITSTEKPKIIEYLGDGSYYYNYNIEKIIDDELDIYSYIQVRLYGKANYADCVKAVIRIFVTSEEEFDLINSMNRTILSGNDDGSINKYKEYLQLLDVIKSNVRSDFYNINS